MAAYARELHAKGQFLATAPLYPTSTATSVRVWYGKRLVTDGPFAETSEQRGGFFVIEAEEAERIFRSLSENGQVQMPIQETFWAVRLGMFVDRFGIPWMVNCPKAS